MKLECLNKCNLCNSTNILLIDKNCNIFKCNNCGYIFDNPRPEFSEIANFYSQGSRYDLWLKEEKARDKLWQRRLKLVMKFKKSGNLLDVGAGIGQFLYFAKKHFKVEGTEISETAIEIAKKKYNLNLKKGQLQDIDFGETKFDVITLFHVLEHVPYPSLVIERCYNLLKEDGIIIIAVPNDINSFKRPFKILFSLLQIGKYKKYGILGLPKLNLDGSIDEIHLSHFTTSSLKKALIRKKFVILKDTLDPYYCALGFSKFIHDLIFLFCLIIQKLLRYNLYETILLITKRKQ